LATIVAVLQHVDVRALNQHTISVVHSIDAADGSDFRKLGSAARRACQDPRDRVYGVLALMATALSQQLTPDYTVPESVVYQQLCIRHIEMTKRLELPFAFRSARDGWRSWVPDFWNGNPFIDNEPAYSASLHSSAHYRFISSDGLEVIGIEHGRVAFVHEEKAFQAEEIPKVLSSWYQQVTSAAADAELTIEDDFVDVINGGRINYPGAPGVIPWPSFDEAKHYFKRCGNSSQGSYDGPYHVENTVRFSVLSRTLFKLHDGLFGTSSHQAQQGVLYVIFNCDTKH
jgi:hypothetical protein